MKPVVLIVRIVLVMLALAGRASASVTEFTNRAEWFAAIGGLQQSQTISFLGFPRGTLLNDQYADLGVTFPDGNDYVANSSSFLLDGAGAFSLFGPITIQFDEPVSSIGVHFPGALVIELYLNDALVYTSSAFGGAGEGFFGGIVSSQPFNSAHLSDPSGDVFVDTIHFGLTIPGPASVASLLIGGVLLCRSRRRC